MTIEDHGDLDRAGTLLGEGVGKWGEDMIRLNWDYSIPVLGGCCGTEGAHISYLAKKEK